MDKGKIHLISTGEVLVCLREKNFKETILSIVTQGMYTIFPKQGTLSRQGAASFCLVLHGLAASCVVYVFGNFQHHILFNKYE